MGPFFILFVRCKYSVQFLLLSSQPNCPYAKLCRVSLQQNELFPSLTKVNGCELPGGNILRVEPSNPYYKVTANFPKSDSRKEKEEQSSTKTVEMGADTSGVGLTEAKTYHNTEGETTEKQSENSGDGVNEEEDLDDFFASLE